LFIFCWNWWNCCPLLFKLQNERICPSIHDH
jgi:hypothetical protein